MRCCLCQPPSSPLTIFKGNQPLTKQNLNKRRKKRKLKGGQEIWKRELRENVLHFQNGNLYNPSTPNWIYLSPLFLNTPLVTTSFIVIFILYSSIGSINSATVWPISIDTIYIVTYYINSWTDGSFLSWRIPLNFFILPWKLKLFY